MMFIRLLYGSSLRLMECLRLRVKDAVPGVQHGAWTLLTWRGVGSVGTNPS